MDVHLRDLRYFVAVAEEHSFTRAAARLYVSQPAMSKQVRQLEQQLRTTLFRRGRGEVSLTAAGVALLPHAREQLLHWERAQRDVAEAVAAEAAVLTVGFSTAVSRGLLTAAHERFRRGHPGWRLQMRQVPWDDPYAGLADASTDVALVWLPLPDPDRFGWRELVREPRHVALPARHRLAGRAEVAFDDLYDEPFLALPDSAGPLREFWLATEHRGGRPARIGGTVATGEETFEAVANGLGVALLSAGNAAMYRHSGVVTRPVAGVGPSRLAVVWRRDDPRDVTRDLVDACVGVAADAADGADPGAEAPPADVPAGPSRPAPAPEHLRIGVSGHTDAVQQRLLSAFAHGRPALPVSVEPSDSTAARVEGVRTGALDLAFVRVDRAPLPDLDHRGLVDRPLLLAVPADHHLAAAEGPAVPLGALHGQPLAFYHRDQNPWWYDDVLGTLRDHGAEPDVVHRGMWAFDVLSQVVAGRALGLVSTTVAAEARLEGVVYRRLEPRVLRASQGLVWRRDARGGAVERFLDAIEHLHPAATGD